MSEVNEAFADLQKASRPTARLQRITELQMALNIALDAQVVECVVVDGWSWQSIGDTLGVSRQAASKRWTKNVDSARRSGIRRSSAPVGHPDFY